MPTNLVSDWVKLLQRRYANSFQAPQGSNPIRTPESDDVSILSAEVIFGLCDTFKLSFEAKHLALDCFNRVVYSSQPTLNAPKRLLPARSGEAATMRREIRRVNLKQRLFNRALSCVQLASKVTNSQASVEPKHINASFPQIT